MANTLETSHPYHITLIQEVNNNDVENQFLSLGDKYAETELNVFLITYSLTIKPRFIIKNNSIAIIAIIDLPPSTNFKQSTTNIDSPYTCDMEF